MIKPLQSISVPSPGCFLLFYSTSATRCSPDPIAQSSITQLLRRESAPATPGTEKPLLKRDKKLKSLTLDVSTRRNSILPVHPATGEQSTGLLSALVESPSYFHSSYSALRARILQHDPSSLVLFHYLLLMEKQNSLFEISSTWKTRLPLIAPEHT